MRRNIIPINAIFDEFLQASAHSFDSSVIALHDSVARRLVCTPKRQAHAPVFTAFFHSFGRKWRTVVTQYLVGKSTRKKFALPGEQSPPLILLEYTSKQQSD